MSENLETLHFYIRTLLCWFTQRNDLDHLISKFFLYWKMKGNNNASFTPNKISNWSLFKLIFSDQALIISKLIFAYILVFHSANVSRCFDKFIFQSSAFWVKNVKIDFFEEFFC